MYRKSPVGKKVNLLKNVDSNICQMTDEVCEVVSVVPWSQELNDWCQHYVVIGVDGTEKEIREVDCVFSPNNEKPADRMAYDFLKDNGVYAEVQHFDSDAVLSVGIEWGDWKHDHIWAVTLMKYIGYDEVGSEITEEDGSDTYSAVHYFVKKA